MFTFGLYIDMPFVHFWGGLGMPLVHLAQQGDEFSRVGFVLLCCLFTFGGDLDTLLVHVWGWSSLVGVILTCRWFTSGLYLDMPSVHCWGWSSLLGVVLTCCLFTFWGGLDTGWASRVIDNLGGFVEVNMCCVFVQYY